MPSFTNYPLLMSLAREVIKLSQTSCLLSSLHQKKSARKTEGQKVTVRRGPPFLIAVGHGVLTKQSRAISVDAWYSKVSLFLSFLFSVALCSSRAGITQVPAAINDLAQD